MGNLDLGISVQNIAPALGTFKNIKDKRIQTASLKEQYTKLSGQLKLIRCKTTEQANEWAKHNLNIDYVDYTGFDIKVANIVNKELKVLQEVFPEVIKKVEWVGTIQKYNEYLKNSDKWDEWLNPKNNTFEAIVNDYPYFAEDIDFIQGLVNRDDIFYYQYAKNYFIQAYLNLQGQHDNCFAQVENLFVKGITFNEFWVKNYVRFLEGIKVDMEVGYCTIGADTIESVVTHESGHCIQDYLEENKEDSFITEAWNDFYKWSSSKMRNGNYGYVVEALSTYATKNKNEFFAEAFTEYMCSSKPRKIASNVGMGVEEAFRKLRSIT